MEVARTLRIFYTNIRSLSAHYNELLLHLDADSRTDYSYDIVALSETWATSENLKLFPLKSYNTYIATRDDGRKSGGVVYYVRENIRVESGKIVYIFGTNALQLKIQCAKERNECDNRLTLYLLYRDCSSNKQYFINSLEEELLNEAGNQILLIGDININLLNENESAEYLNMVMSQGCLSIQNQPTREQNCLDHVITNIDESLVNCKIKENWITDHAILEIEVKIANAHQNLEEKRLKIRSEKHFQKFLLETDWNWVKEVELNSNLKISVNRDFDKLFGIIQTCSERATKVKTINMKVGNRGMRKRQPWMTSELLSMVNEKSRVYRRLQQQKDSSELRAGFKLISAKLKKAIRLEKVKYYSTLLDVNCADPRKYWEIINEARGKKNKSKINKINIMEEVISVENCPERVAHEFNVFFNNVAENLIEKSGMRTRETMDIGKQGKVVSQKYGTRIERESRIALKKFSLTIGDIEKAIRSLKNKKSTGADRIAAGTIKEQIKLFSEILLPLFSKSLNQGAFPDLLKLILVVPVPKGGDEMQMTNYRPVALLSCIAKVFEKCVKEKLLNYLNHIQFFAKQQFGFIAKKSTDMALFNHITNITENIEKNNAAVGVYLDLAKAFDTVNHERLAKKLEEIGFQGSLLRWLKSYLDKREQAVKINDIISPKLQVKHGVPQGSVLGPLLFNIYINDIFELPLRGRIMGYADDTSLLYSANTVEKINADFEHDEEILTSWFRANFLHLNVNKCCYILYSFKEMKWKSKLNLKIGNEVLERVKKAKYLGVTLDEKLIWKEHSLVLQSKLRKLNFLFYHLKNYFNEKHLKKLYLLLYESVFTYGIIHWGASKHIRPIKILQNKVCRSILSLPPRTTESIIYTRMNVLKLEDVYKYRLRMFLFKNQDLFRLHYNVASQTRQAAYKQAAYPQWRKEHSRMQAGYQGPILFNVLPPTLREEKRLSVYKRQVRAGCP